MDDFAGEEAPLGAVLALHSGLGPPRAREPGPMATQEVGVRTPQGQKLTPLGELRGSHSTLAEGRVTSVQEFHIAVFSNDTQESRIWMD